VDRSLLQIDPSTHNTKYFNKQGRMFWKSWKKGSVFIISRLSFGATAWQARPSGANSRLARSSPPLGSSNDRIRLMLSASPSNPSVGLTTDSQENAAARRAAGEFVRGVSSARHWITDAPDAVYPPQGGGRYHLYVAYNCKFAPRVGILGTSPALSL
jgi:hypothetical protein